MWFEYLLFNVIVGVPPLVAMGFLKKENRVVSRAYIWTWLVALVFIVWDVIVTGKWWYFNSQYISGWNIFGLPVEECLFFVTVPWACLVIWQQLRGKKEFLLFAKRWSYGVAVLALFLGVMSFLFAKYYTSTVLVISSLVIFIDLRTFEISRRKSGVYFLLISSLLIVVFNGYLTGRPVVLYNPDVKLPITLGTIPVEDFFYGWSLLLASVLMYEYFFRQIERREA